jgi:hypothetical protein
MELFRGTSKMAIETNTKVVPIAIEQYDNRFVINFGNELLPTDFCSAIELIQKLRDDLATLKWEIWAREGVQERKSLPPNYRATFRKQFESRIAPYDTLDTVEKTRYHREMSSSEGE